MPAFSSVFAIGATSDSRKAVFLLRKIVNDLATANICTSGGNEQIPATPAQSFGEEALKRLICQWMVEKR